MNEVLVGWKPVSAKRRVASARLRCFAPLARLRRAGFPVERFSVENESRYRVVVLQKLFDREHLALAERLQAQGTQVVFDLCDNLLFNPTGEPAVEERAGRLREMLKRADIVTVSTSALAEHLEHPCTVIRDGVEPCGAGGWLSALWPRRPHSRLELVWYGIAAGSQPSTGMCDLLTIAEPLRDLARRLPLRLSVISNSRKMYREIIAPLPFPTRYRRWGSHGNLCRLLPRHDICVIPFQRTPFTVCKSCNRLALSLSLGVPVAATAIPAYREFGAFCVLDDWENGLRAYAQSPDLRRRHADAGRAYVNQHYTLEKAAEEWRGLFEQLLAAN